jgi:hypothetical protein
MSNHHARLTRLQEVWRNPDPPKPSPCPTLDVLTHEEKRELDQLLRWLAPLNADDLPDRPMTEAELARLDELMARAGARLWR